MPELERQLRELGIALELPAAPDLVDVVRARIGEEHEPRLRMRRSLVLAIAALGLALAAAMAVPQARTAILEFLHIRGASVEKVLTLPSVSGSGLDLGEPVSLEDARDTVSFEVAQPELPGLGRPDLIYVDRATPGGQVFFLWGTEARPQVLLSEFRGDLNRDLIGKLAGPQTTIEPVSVQGGAPGFWVAGANHVVYYLDRDGEIQEETIRLSRNALLWERNDLTLRLEGDFGKDVALELARSVP
jgi:hypothetical protein